MLMAPGQLGLAQDYWSLKPTRVPLLYATTKENSLNIYFSGTKLWSTEFELNCFFNLQVAV